MVVRRDSPLDEQEALVSIFWKKRRPVRSKSKRAQVPKSECATTTASAGTRNTQATGQERI